MRVPLSEAEETCCMLHKGCVSGRAVVEVARAQVI